MDYTVTGPKELSKSGKERTPVLHEGKAAWLYGENGSRSIRNDNGHWLARVESGAELITAETSKQLNATRWENARKAASLGALSAAEERGELLLSDPVEAWQAVVKARTLVALDTDSRGGNAAAELVGRAAGWLANRNEQQPAEANITLNKAGLAALVQAITAEQGKRDAVDGSWVDDDGGGE